MNLAGLLSLFEDNPDWLNFLKGSGERKSIVLDSAKPFLIARISFDLKVPMLVITPSAESAKKMHEELSAWSYSHAAVYLFPELGVLPYERLIPDSATVQQRLRVLAAVTERTSILPIVVASAHAISQKTISAAEFAVQRVSRGSRLDMNQFLAKCVDMGYEVDEIVEIQGEMSKRGGIIDLYSPNNDLPARIEFVGNVVESIRWFEPGTQRSIEPTDSLTIVPAREILLPGRGFLEEVLAKLDLSNCDDHNKDILLQDMALFRNSQWIDRLGFYTPLFNRGSILDYFPEESLVVLDDPEAIVTELTDSAVQTEGVRQTQIERGELPRGFPLPCLQWTDIQKAMGRMAKMLSLVTWGNENTDLQFRSVTVSSYCGRVSSFLDAISKSLKNGRRIIVVSQQADRLAELLSEQDIIVAPQDYVNQLPSTGSLTLVRGSLAEGWEFGETLLLTDRELFGFVKRRRSPPKRHAQHEAFLADLSIGDHVVHIDHGIAVFSGMVRMSPDGTEREYLILEYAESDKLYLPSDQVDRVARYIGPGRHLPALSRLNTHEWARTKQRVRRAADDLAAELLSIYASREMAEGVAFSPDTLWQQELEASFPYVETQDQMQAIRDIKHDMESLRPMDRLVCGDVGYGKTEVALRAAFKAVLDGKQVAVLVPTTVLAQQHFTTFSERLAAFPIEIEVLSRFRSPKEQKAILERLRNGSLDVCIGTHRLLQRDVAFDDLGLVIIDEEQKFGVGHKERLKKLRSEVDILTLSATPIPRTLHMSLIGVRDMSTMETPPEDRLPIKTYVAEYNEELIKGAIMREIDRNGQVFFLHNRVQSINLVAHQLRALVPDVRIVVAHGQMPEEILESAMLEFMCGNVDVMVCTTIIESGLDIPNVNTLIVNDADKLGLTQLYHLRGRVGRGDVRAYAYFLYEKNKHLTESARKRLETIFEATELGAGFRIAMKDLEIRGAGNILGSEQSGQMESVGFDLYCRLLSEAVEQLKGGGEKEMLGTKYPVVDLPLAAYLPEKYVADLNTRIALYQRLANVDSLEQLKDMRQELRDRFGEIPQPTQNLLSGVRIKLLAVGAGVQKITTEGTHIVLVVSSDKEIDRFALQRHLGSSIKIGTRQMRLDTRQLGHHWIRILEDLLQRMTIPSAGRG